MNAAMELLAGHPPLLVRDGPLETSVFMIPDRPSNIDQPFSGLALRMDTAGMLDLANLIVAQLVATGYHVAVIGTHPTRVLRAEKQP